MGDTDSILSVVRSFPCATTAVRALDPAKDMGDYGYGSIVWKDRLEAWKQQQGHMGMPDGHPPNLGPEGADLPS